MSLLVVGSMAYDTVETPSGKAEEVLGGAATFFSVSASYFTPVRIVACVGDDFRDHDLRILSGLPIDLKGVEHAPGKTFRWSGYYTEDLNTAHTRDTQLNVFANFNPKLPEEFRDTQYLFLGNIRPDLQIEVLEQVRHPRVVGLDSMNFWIESQPDVLMAALKRVDIAVLNEGEVRMLAGSYNIVTAAKWLLARGPKMLVIKRGEYGALLISNEYLFAAPAMPLDEVVDPTGAGDTFAGGFMGSLARDQDLSIAALRRAVIYGSVMASFTVQDFSLRRLLTLDWNVIEQRYEAFAMLTRF